MNIKRVLGKAIL